jgi:hypothetical protein
MNLSRHGIDSESSLRQTKPNKTEPKPRLPAPPLSNPTISAFFSERTAIHESLFRCFTAEKHRCLARASGTPATAARMTIRQLALLQQ